MMLNLCKKTENPHDWPQDCVDVSMDVSIPSIQKDIDISSMFFSVTPFLQIFVPNVQIQPYPPGFPGISQPFPHFPPTNGTEVKALREQLPSEDQKKMPPVPASESKAEKAASLVRLEMGGIKKHHEISWLSLWFMKSYISTVLCGY